jgi:hypothetical protein
MERFMHRRSQSTPGLRRFAIAVEPLENRWLLSGVETSAPLADSIQQLTQAASQSDAAYSAAISPGMPAVVEAVRFGVVADDDESDVEITPAQLPNEIVAAIDNHFPGAELLGAELATQAESAVYEVNTKLGGQYIDVSLTPDGSIIETKQELAAGELPHLVLNWFKQYFPGAVIHEAELVTEADMVSYDVRIAAFGLQEYEGKFRVRDAEALDASSRSRQGASAAHGAILTSTSFAAAQPVVATSPYVAAPENESSVSESSETSEASEATEGQESRPEGVGVNGSSREQTESHMLDSLRSPAQSGLSSTTQLVRANLPTLSARHRQPENVAAATPAAIETVAEPGATTWLPQLAGVLADVLPVDLAVVEQGIQQLLDEIDELAAGVGGAPTVANAALQMAIVAALFTGADLVILHSRKAGSEPVLDCSTANSSWSWVLGTAKPKLR